MNQYYILLLIAVILVLACVYVYYKSKSNNIENFETNSIVVRLFYVDWCGFCKTTKPEFIKFMNKYNNKTVNNKKISIQMINCEENAESARLAEEMKVESYPTIIAVINGKEYTFQNERNENGFIKWTNHLCKSN